MKYISRFNGWTRLLIVFSIIYGIFVAFIMYGNRPWEEQVKKQIFKIAPVPVKKEHNVIDSNLKYSTNEDLNKRLLKPPADRVKRPSWQIEYDKLIRESIPKANEYINKIYREALERHGFTSAQYIKMYADEAIKAQERVLEYEAIIYGPKSFEWIRCLSQHTLYVENPEFEDVLLEMHRNYIVKEFINNPKNKAVTFFISSIVIVIMFLFYWLLPIIAFCFICIIVVKTTHWIMDGFKGSSSYIL